MRIEKQIAELETSERQHAGVERQLSQDLVLIDERLKELRQQRNLMRTRQSRAEALKAIRSSESNALSEIDEIFERWEARVSEYEMQGAAGQEPEDELEAQYLSQEEEQSLKKALEELQAHSQQHS